MMKPNFKNLIEFKRPLSEFPLQWRFKDPDFDQLAPDLLAQLIPLEEEAALFLWSEINQFQFYKGRSLDPQLFKEYDQLQATDSKAQEIQMWLDKRRIPGNQLIALSWEATEAMLLPWAIFVEHYACFWYPSSDDLTIFDLKLSWVLDWSHFGLLSFGRK
ncbi:hypothetical protein [Croceimicrobium hydrocarbonivorans]|uniref:Uncharacterized protein n=1 Tax=Croceimicrobium hydrocarbonivorans TaxID=2761580 RepID=A0A7H0VH29_9FLAO|nr:hypothetical protein [Croceimicrobium hydrocarbonivorans]QNR25027.1 hypothetical protein H4K34_04050 [Croceimicrobium hydrocarbonivorans]